MGEKVDSAIEKLHVRIAELEEERDDQFYRANEWRDQAEKQRMRAEAAESALAQAEARLGSMCAYPMCDCKSEECRVIDGPIPEVCMRSDLVEAEAREAELVGAVIKAAEVNREIPDDWKHIDAGQMWAVAYGFGVLDAVTVLKQALAATPERTKAAAEILRLATHGAGINFTLVTNAVRRYAEAASLDQPESG